MLKNYLKSTFRSLGHKKGYTFINLLGLTLGMVCFAVISYWVLDELSFDTFHTQSERIYRIAGSVQTPSDQFEQAVTSPPVARALKQDMTAIEEAVRIDKNDAIVRRETVQFKENDILLTDPAFFSMFDFRLLQGNPRAALENPYSIVLSQSMARRYFGLENPLGKTLRVFLYDPEGRGADYTVTGIVEDAPSNSHIRYNFLVSFSTMEENFPQLATEGWFDNFIYTYLLLEAGTDPAVIEEQLPLFLQHHVGEAMQQYQMFYRYRLQPLKKIYLHSDLRYELSAGGDFRYIIVFVTIGIFILVLAGINYINLATAFAVDRLKDAGIRKVNGASRFQLVMCYLLESLVLIGTAFLCTLLILELTVPYLHSMIGQEQIELVSSGVIYYLAGAALLIGIISGLFPSIYLSSVNPINGLKGNPGWFGKSSSLRKVLVVFQFSITVLLLAGIFVIRDQLDFIRKKDLGFDKHALMTISVNGSPEVFQNYPSFKQDLAGHSAIAGIARSNTSIGDGLGNSMGIARDKQGNQVRGTVFRAGIDHAFIPTYGLTLLAGRNYSLHIPSDSSKAFIVNEAAVITFGWGSPEKAIGKPFQFGDQKGFVIGVVNNFNFSTLYNPIQPVCLYLLGDGYSKITVKAANNSVKNLLPLVERAWKEHFPGTLFEYGFVDDQLEQQYMKERQLRDLFVVLSTLALVIACIGLYGLAGFSSKRRTKEIGVRKALGATVRQITLMLNGDYLKLILIAFLIGSAGAWFLMRKWLQQFAYKTELSVDTFILAGSIAFIIALLSVSGQSIRAALINPVDSLRDE